MKRLNKTIGLFLLLCHIVFSCTETPITDDAVFLEEEIIENTRIASRSSSNDSYDTLPNPYALSVMQNVYDTYCESSVSLEATDLYVKFMVKDSAELYTLKYDYNLELFDYPLDIELTEGEVYVNTALPESDLTWVYTTVEPDFVFPQGISYEILEECYIPADNEVIYVGSRGGAINVEDIAFAMMGYNESPSAESRANATPQGTIQVYNNNNELNEPVKGVKIRCHRIIKWATAYTNENGQYTMGKSFRYKPHYAIVFDNIKDFDIWGNWGPIARANYNLGWQKNTGYSVDIVNGHYAWDWAVVNNAAYEYYQMCELTGIPKPPSKLKIWVWKDFCDSSAPMLRRITNAIGFNGHSSIANFFINMIYGLTATRLNTILRVILPDLTIGTLDSSGNRKGYNSIYQIVNHELAHASHFSVVGSPYWAKYVSYIMTYGAYGGNDSGNNAQLCAIGEMWGHFVGYTQAIEKFGKSSQGIRHLVTIDSWIYPQVFWDIYSSNILSKKQIFDCLSDEVNTYNKLVAKLYTLYPEQAASIEQVLNKYPAIKHSINIPGTSNIKYDTFCSDRNITSPTIISGENILVQNCTVSNGASLRFDARSSITINKPFEMENGSTLIMAHPN